MRIQNKQSGLTLIEMMIAIVVGLIIVAGTIGIFITSLKLNSETLQMTRLNQELQAVMTLMTRDIRRSGYWGITTSGTVNAYASVAATSNQSGGAGDDCILLAYDIDSNGLGGGNDYIGYKWDTDHIEMKVANAAFTCGSGGWTDLSDSAVVNISEPVLDIVAYTAGTTTNEVNVLTLELTGTLVGDALISRTIKQTIRLRNDVIN